MKPYSKICFHAQSWIDLVYCFLKIPVNKKIRKHAHTAKQ
jgi:hypothetical protein